MFFQNKKYTVTISLWSRNCLISTIAFFIFVFWLSFKISTTDLSIAERSRPIFEPLFELKLSKSSEKTKKLKNFAYVQLVDTAYQDDYFKGVVATQQAFKELNISYPLVVLAAHSIDSDFKLAFESYLGLKVIVKTWSKRLTTVVNSVASGENENERYFNKLLFWTLLEFDKIIILDTDMVVVQNLDFLFDEPCPSMATDTVTGLVLNTGIMVIEPSNTTFNSILDFVRDKRKHLRRFELLNDQPVLNRFFNSNYTTKRIKILPALTNLLIRIQDLQRFETFESEVGFEMFKYIMDFAREEVKVLHLSWPKPSWPAFADNGNFEASPSKYLNTCFGSLKLFLERLYVGLESCGCNTKYCNGIKEFAIKNLRAIAKHKEVVNWYKGIEAATFTVHGRKFVERRIKVAAEGLKNFKIGS